ncbi:MAG: NupC/NupG family nucleoside CNT transporter [Gemmataceae bacterium]
MSSGEPNSENQPDRTPAAPTTSAEFTADEPQSPKTPEPPSDTGESDTGESDTPPTPWFWRLAILTFIVAQVCFLYLAEDSLSLRVKSLLGFMTLLTMGVLFSKNLRLVRWRTIAMGLLLQLSLVWFILELRIYGLEWLGIPDGFGPGTELFRALGEAVRVLLDQSSAGTKILFGSLAEDRQMAVLGIVPPIIFFSSLFTILYYFGILQFIVRMLGRVMMTLMGTSGAETLSAAANVFLGMTEAPLVIKPYILRMTRSELFTMMVGGMATISGGMMAVYVGLGADSVALLTTSVMAAPCGLLLSKLILPETKTPVTAGLVRMDDKDGEKHVNVVDAATTGASAGLKLAANVVAMLIAFLALLALVDYLLGQLPTGQSLITTFQDQSGSPLVWKVCLVGLGFVPIYFLASFLSRRYIGRGLLEWRETETTGQVAKNILKMVVLCVVYVVLLDRVLWLLPQQTTLGTIFGTLFSPLALLIGIPSNQQAEVANLLGLKLAANEFVAFQQLTTNYKTIIPAETRTFLITNFALTGFANFGSVGIQIGGIGALVPERRSDLAQLGIPAMLVGFLATLMNAALAGCFLALEAGPPPIPGTDLSL